LLLSMVTVGNSYEVYTSKARRKDFECFHNKEISV
jgi:hypothetical protein